tara:strand:- start:648 stop:941 length:294 start_codon:yes stop_codon:yes gene_type:complete
VYLHIRDQGLGISPKAVLGEQEHVERLSPQGVDEFNFWLAELLSQQGIDIDGGVRHEESANQVTLREYGVLVLFALFAKEDVHAEVHANCLDLCHLE